MPPKTVFNFNFAIKTHHSNEKSLKEQGFYRINFFAQNSNANSK